MNQSQNDASELQFSTWHLTTIVFRDKCRILPFHGFETIQFVNRY